MSWLVYAVSTGVLVGAAAVAAERLLRASGRPGRVVWSIAPLVTVGLPAFALLGWTGVQFAAVDRAGVVTVAEVTTASGPDAAALVIGAWATLSGIALVLLFLQTHRMRRSARDWTKGSVSGVPVLISPDTGPATLGVFRSSIVVPRWLFEMDVRSRRLAVLHEQEHRRAGDVALLNAMAILVALVPWHPVLWWQAARLHRAIELDCDERVVRRVRDRAGYGRMLLEAATRCIRSVPLAAGLGLRRPLLEQRIRILVARPARRASATLALLVPAMIALACALPTPFDPMSGDDLIRSTYRYTGWPGDSLRAVGVTPARPEPGDTAATATYEIRELPAAGVLRRADREGSRIRGVAER